jgi:hypothetical protein
MDELVIFILVCLMVPSIFIAIYWPVTTAIALSVIALGGISWAVSKQKQIDYNEDEYNRQRRIKEHPEINSVYIPDFDLRFREETKKTKKLLQSRDLPDVLSMLESIEKMVEEKIIPRKPVLMESLQNYLRENRIAIVGQIESSEKLIQETNREERKMMLQETIKNLKEKLKMLEQSKEEIIYFYSYVRNIFLQIENMRLKSTQLTDEKRLLLDLKQDLSTALNSFSDANSLLDDISKI